MNTRLLALAAILSIAPALAAAATCEQLAASYLDDHAAVEDHGVMPVLVDFCAASGCESCAAVEVAVAGIEPPHGGCFELVSGFEAQLASPLPEAERRLLWGLCDYGNHRTGGVVAALAPWIVALIAALAGWIRRSPGFAERLPGARYLGHGDARHQ